MPDSPSPPPVATLLAEMRRRLSDGEPARVEDDLARYPTLREDPDALLALVRGEVLAREQGGETPEPDEYRRRFPGLSDRLTEVFAVRSTLGPDEVPSTVVPPPLVVDTPRRDDGWPAPPGYRVEGVLGAGGMGVVYLARDLRRGVAVALKSMRRADPAALYRFKQEFRNVLGVAHPNLVTLHELVSDGDSLYIVMERIDGVDLLSHVRGEGGGLDAAGLARLRDAWRQLVEALMALHAAGVVHRDVKPSNVMVTPSGRVVLMDFGLATGLDRGGHDRSTEGQVVGTPAYMSPEQAMGGHIAEASDWYSVGVMLYQALTGRMPFEGGALAMLMERQKRDPAPPRALAPGVPPDLDALCVDLLRRDPGERPSGAAILARLGGPCEAVAEEPRSATTADLSFVGRGAQMAALADAYDALARGRTVLVTVEGASGVGKTALVQNFLQGLAAREPDAVVLSGRCYERESVPYKALDGLIDALSRLLRRLPEGRVGELLPRDVAALARVFPVLRRVEAVAGAPSRAAEVPDPQEMRRRARAALREMLARLGDRRRLVLAIDDLQWGDEDSLAVLSEVLRPPDPPALLLLACLRTDAEGDGVVLRQVRGWPVSGPMERREIRVGPLSPDEARALAGHWGASSEIDAEAVAREAGGNPFFVTELARSMRAAGPGRVGGLSLDEMIWSCVLGLPEDARRLLEVLAVAGRPLRPEFAWGALGLEGDERKAMAILRAERLARTAAGAQERAETYHDRVRESIASRLSADSAREYHRRLALAYEAEERRDPEALAIHHAGAGEDARASVCFAEAAAAAADALAFERAAALYRRAIDLRGRSDDVRALREALAGALANAGRGSEAADEYLAACQGATVAGALELRRRAAMQLLISGHIDRGLETLRDVLKSVGMSLPATPRRALLALLARRAFLWLRGLRFRQRDASEIAPADLTRVDVCWSAGIGLSNVDWVRGADFQARGLLLALRAGEPSRVGRALAVEAAQTATAGVSAAGRTEALLDEAGRLSARAGGPHGEAMVTLARGVSAYLLGRWGESLARCDEAEAAFRDRCTGVAWELDTAHAYSLWSLSHLGRWAELSRRFPALVAEARERGDLYAAMNLSTYIAAIARLAADDPRSAREEIHRVAGAWSRDGYHVQHNDFVWALALVDLYEGRGLEARERVARHWTALERSLLLRVQFIRVAMLGLRARCALAAASDPSGPGPAAGPWLREALRDASRLDREGLDWASAQANLARAGVAALGGRNDDAARELRLAADRFLGCDMEICAAACAHRLGAILGGDEGLSLRAGAAATFEAQSVRRGDRVADLYAPGFAAAAPPG